MKHPFTLAKCVAFSLAGSVTHLGASADVTRADAVYATSGIECFVVQNASTIRRDSTEGMFGRANVGHQIGADSKNVLAIRAYSGLASIDRQEFWKVTLEFAELPRSLATGLPVKIPVLSSYYSHGGITWIEDGLYEWAHNPFTHFVAVRSEHGLEVRLDETITATRAFDNKQRQVTVARKCPVTYKHVALLSAWEGKIGTTIRSFDPRKMGN